MCFHSPIINEREKPSVATGVGVDVSDGADAVFCAVEVGIDFSRLL